MEVCGGAWRCHRGAWRCVEVHRGTGGVYAEVHRMYSVQMYEVYEVRGACRGVEVQRWLQRYMEGTESVQVCTGNV